MEGIGSLSKLKDLWLNNNEIDGLEQLREDLAGACGSIRGIYLSDNPVAKNKSEYTAVLLSVLGSLEELDGDDVVRGT